jgi:predicted permease
MHQLMQDLRLAARMLVKAPVFAVIVILTIGLGIGANAAVFSVLNSFILRPMPVHDPSNLAVLAIQHEGNEQPHSVSYLDYLDYRAEGHAFSDIGAFYITFAGLSADGRADRLTACFVTSNLFSMLGVGPAEGRVILPSDGDTPGTGSIVVLGHSYWLKRFAGDRSVVGRSVMVNGRPFTVAGVVPASFRGPYSIVEFDAYLPMSMVAIDSSGGKDVLTKRDSHSMRLLGRLAPGVGIKQAQSAMDVVATRLERQYPDTNKTVRARVFPEYLARPEPNNAGQIPMVGAVFMVMVGLVLLVACVNVVNLMLVRATGRRRELAVRAALGAGRPRLMRQLITESLLIAAAGGVAGLAFGSAVSRLLGRIHLPGDLPFRFDFSFDWRVYAYVTGLAIVTGVLVGVLPALRASRADLNDVLREGGRSQAEGGRSRLRKGLVIAQVAVSLVLLIAAGLFVRSLGNAQRIDLGFDPAYVLNLSMDVGQQGYSDARGTTFYRELESRVASLPGVTSVSYALSAPMGYNNSAAYVDIESRPVERGQRKPIAGFNAVGARYFDTMKVPLRRGRGFTEHDDAHSTPVAVVSELMAARFWPNEDPIGKRFKGDDLGPAWVEVIGVAANGQYTYLFADPAPYFFVPIAQQYRSMRVLHLRTAAAPESLMLAARTQVRALDPDLPVYDVMPMADVLQGGNGFFLLRMGAAFAGALGLLGLVLAAIGIYGVVSYAASQRTQEIGIRVALGAQARDVLRLVVGQGLGLVLVGIALGLAAAYGMSRFLTTLLFGISPNDLVTFASVPAVLGTIALAACWIPARRAARVDPVTALRGE